MKIINKYSITLCCFAIGYIFFHPLAMVLGHFMVKIEAPQNDVSISLIILEFFKSYSVAMIPWGFIFGTLSGWIGYYFMRLKQQKEDLKKANITKEKFVSIIAHDLRSPFLPLIGFTELLLNRGDEFAEAQKKDYLKAIRESAQRIHSLLENLLEWSRMQSETIEVHPVKINMHDLINEIVLLLTDIADRKTISIRSLVNTDASIVGDWNMISLIFNNLLQNAIKFTPTGGNIEIRSKAEGKHVTITVIDDGIGMTAEETRGLFRIDVKRSKPGTNDEQGSGLGLILCEEFAEQNEGKISVISKPGEGSQFSVKLPAFGRDRNSRGRLIRE